MSKYFKIFLLSLTGLVGSLSLVAQTSDFGTIGSVAISKDLGRFWSAKAEQELRFNQNSTLYNRSMTTIGVDYAILKKVLKAGFDYDFMHLNRLEYFEFRHRVSTSLSAKLDMHSWGLEWRTKGQATLRDETRGDYNYNPKYVWRNQIEFNYSIFGSPFKPYVSAEIFCPLQSKHGFYIDGLRAVLGLKFRVSQRNSLDFKLRFDQDLQQANPQSMLYGVVGWNYKL